LNACLAFDCFFVEYQHQAHAQFKVFGDQVKAWDEKIEAMTTGIKPVLDYIGFKPSKGRELLPRDPEPRSILDWCRTTRSNFKEFTRSATHGAVIHALAQLWSHYPLVDVQRVVTGYAHGIDATKITRLENKVE